LGGAGPELQVIARGTSLPDDAALGPGWQVFRRDAGRLTASARKMESDF